jgi:prepilin-type N-terminal cleavage/methylation domain-containing protein
MDDSERSRGGPHRDGPWRRSPPAGRPPVRVRPAPPEWTAPRGWPAPRGRPAFTLVELLVVVAIISLLVSILLPSLEGARHQALMVKCQAHQGAIARAAAAYQADELGWLPGSPGTSGTALLGGRYAAAGETFEPMPEPPVQIWDWAGPLAAREMRMSLPANRGERFGQLVSGVFECPANGYFAVPYHGGMAGATGRFKVQRMISYNTLRQFMCWPTSAGAPAAEAVYDVPGAVLARDYQPRIDRVGSPSENVFLADGSRFTNASGNPDFDINWRGAYGGAFADGGPTLPDAYLRSFWRTDPQRLFSYRHPQGKRPGLVAVYFDGHAACLSEERSRYPDPWWPKGTVLPLSEFNADTARLVQALCPGAATYTIRR